MAIQDLNGKVALVTGGASGIGLATVQRLAKEGATVVVADLNAEQGEQVARDVGGTFQKINVGEPADWLRVMADVSTKHGGVDVAYLNAGVTTQQGDITELTEDQYRRIMGANVDGVVYGVRAVVPSMAARGGGAIVCTASLAGLIAFAPDPIAFAPDPIYTLTKHAVVGLVRSLAPQLEAKGVSIHAICPGIVDTPLVGEARGRLKEAGFPMIDPADIADAVVNAVQSEETGVAWACQPGRREKFEFPEAPGPRGAGIAGMRPPALS
jgi:NAD(P)-dependent dehydrogenase (short-subunit alcohol dehydrogenase family)